MFHSWPTDPMGRSWRWYYIGSYSCDHRLCFCNQAHPNGIVLYIFYIFKYWHNNNYFHRCNMRDIILPYSIAASPIDGVINDIYSYDWFRYREGSPLSPKTPKEVNFDRRLLLFARSQRIGWYLCKRRDRYKEKSTVKYKWDNDFAEKNRKSFW